MIRVLIVDDQNFTRKALRAVLKNEQNLIIVGEAENGIKALELMEQFEIDLAVVDLDMPEMNGFELTQKISQNFPQTKVIILSSHDDRDSINQAVNFGARGYLLKDTSISEVVDTINYVQRGYFQLGPGLFEKLIAESINYELKTSDYLSELGTKSESNFSSLKQEIINQNKQVSQEVFQELEIKTEQLKFELKQGLNKFQSQVYKQLQSGFDNFANNQKTSQFNPDFLHQQYLEITQNINSIEKKHQLSLNRLAKEIVVWRYSLIFLLIVFCIEKTAIFWK